MKILIVDDERDVRDYLRRLLEINNFQVIEADSGESALYALAKMPDIDLIVLDWIMPGMGGEQTLRDIKEQFDDIPILMLSAKTENSDIVKALEFGAIDYLMKPLDKEHFLFKIKDILKTSRESARKHAARRKNVNFHASAPMVITAISSREVYIESNFPIKEDTIFVINSDALLRMIDAQQEFRITCKAISCKKKGNKYNVRCHLQNLSSSIAQKIEDAAVKATTFDNR